jgi:hypothetical protein
MNKKLVLGCLGAFLLMLIGGAVALYVFIWKPMSTMTSGAIESVKNTVTQTVDSAKKLEELNAGILNTTPFTPPADGLLTPEQVDALVAINESMYVSLGDKIQSLEGKYKPDTSGAAPAEPSLSDLSKSFSALGDLAALLGDAKKAQVVALNAQNVSLEEYRWVSTTAFAALTAGAAIEAVGQSQPAIDALKAASEQIAQAQSQIGAVTGQSDPEPAVETPADSAREPSPQEAALRANFLLIQPHREAIAKGQILAMLPL